MCDAIIPHGRWWCGRPRVCRGQASRGRICASRRPYVRRRRKRGSGAIADDLVRRHDRCGRRGRSEGGCWALLLLLRSESSTALLPRVHQCYTRLGQQSTKRESSMASGLSDGGCNLIVGDAFCRQPRAQAPEARVQQLGCDRLVHAAHWQRSSSSAGSLDPPAKRVSQRHQATPTSRFQHSTSRTFWTAPQLSIVFFIYY